MNSVCGVSLRYWEVKSEVCRTSEEILLSSQPIPEAKNLMGMQVTESLESESFFKCQILDFDDLDLF